MQYVWIKNRPACLQLIEAIIHCPCCVDFLHPIVNTLPVNWVRHVDWNMFFDCTQSACHSCIFWASIASDVLYKCWKSLFEPACWFNATSKSVTFTHVLGYLIESLDFSRSQITAFWQANFVGWISSKFIINPQEHWYVLYLLCSLDFPPYSVDDYRILFSWSLPRYTGVDTEGGGGCAWGAQAPAPSSQDNIQAYIDIASSPPPPPPQSSQKNLGLTFSYRIWLSVEIKPRAPLISPHFVVVATLRGWVWFR